MYTETCVIEFEDDMTAEWYYLKNQKQNGPCTTAKMRDLARSGELLPTDKVWREGMLEPAVGRLVPGLFGEETSAMSVPKPPLFSNRFDDLSQLPSAIWTLVKAILHHPITVCLSMLCCFPIGLVLLWFSEAISVRWKILIFCGFISLLALGKVLSVKETRSMNDRLAKANSLWHAGDTHDAVEHYRSLLEMHWYRLDKADRSTLIRRVVDFDLANGNVSSAEELIDKAVQGRVNVTFENGMANSIFQELREKQRAARDSTDSRTSDDQPDRPDSDLVDSTELIQAFDNEAAGSDRFDGKTIKVGGPVVKVTQGYASEGPFASKQYYAVIGGELGPNGYKTWVECYFSSSNEATSIQAGSYVVIRGKVQGRSRAAVRMTECIVDEQ